ncbi:MAG: ribulose-phosphate 3-epimerase [Candidatus Omnitrophica bacterium]|nr:ribulose-phosphate 3-epimerase [Candidatus Omnitrophota bacterium]
MKISPSILSADFANLQSDIAKVEAGNCDMLHLDVMDGHFVPNITIGPLVVDAVRKVTQLSLDTHLMIDAPEKYIKEFAEAGSNHITVHYEACPHNLSQVLAEIRSFGCTAGVSIKPGTSENVLMPFLDEIDMILIMSVEPGFGGQKFMPEVLNKIRNLRSVYSKDIEIDGGINTQTAAEAVEAGANVLVAGTAIFKSDNPAETVRQLKNAGKS